ncbi:MAG: efflux RND transporter periplasmic adaptor subunit [Desulfobacterales bacterium]
MTKRIILTLLVLLVVVGILGGIKVLQIKRMIAQGQQFSPPPEPVTTAVAHRETWESLLSAVGSLQAVQGVIVTAELPGKVAAIEFTPGTQVKTGDLLLQQDISSETAQLRAAEATMTLARIDLDRKRKLLSQRTISRSEFDNAEAQYKQTAAQADTIRAAIKKKSIRAPFAGRLGIRQVNVGQVLREGDAIVSLQTIDPVFVNFSFPQQQLALVKTGMPVRVTTEALPGQAVDGKITAINPQVDAATRNIQMQATVDNSDERLRPGMFVNVAVVLPAEKDVLAIPATAVLYAPYGDSVFVVEEKKVAEKKEDKIGPEGKIVRQQFVRIGEKRGDFVAILSGIEQGQTVVSTGAFKLRNGQAVVADNTVAPDFKLTPQPQES